MRDDDEARRSIALWDAKADEWAAWTGEQGDRNRRFISDPVLHRLLGEVRGLRVLDAGCGAGYLAARLARDGADVIAVDASARMIEHARARGLDARVDDVRTLGTIDRASIDRVVSNYVLMDLPDIDSACRAIARVLAPRGAAVLVFTHPCFDGVEPYCEERRVEERWGPFSSDFVFWHRPLARYVGALRDARLEITHLEEPVLDRSVAHPFDRDREQALSTRPLSIAIRVVRAI